MNVVGIDIGGTFTDLVGCVDGRIVTSKTSTVPADPTRGVADSLALAHCEMPALSELLHGSTIAINTVLENKGARTALITTLGFRDTYAIGRGNRIEAFNLFFHRPKPLISRELTFEVTERVNAKGEVLLALAEDEVASLAKLFAAHKIEAVAVCLLHAYANPAHERRIGDILRAADPDRFVTLSHEIVREYREYERTSTTAINAFVGPRVQGYLRRLEGFLRGEAFDGKINIMRSNGGVMSIALAQEQPVSMMESGPVAGMIGAGRLAGMLGLERAIGFDMGGTTAKASLITNGAPAIEEGYVIGGEASGQPMQLPVVDIVEVGAGGGSIAWCDAVGGIHVGPQSAGADPGSTAMIAFGGAGPLHAVAIAREIFIPKVIVPKVPGTFSALGMLMAPWRQDFVRTLYGLLGALDGEAVMRVFNELEAAGRQQAARDGIAERDAVFTFLADLRYVGQEHTIAIPVADAALLCRDIAPLQAMFHAEHDQRYGQAAPDERLECVNVRLVVTAGKVVTLAEQWLAHPWQPEPPVAEGVRDVVFTDAAKPVRTRVIWRPSLTAGARIEGPAVIEEPNATTLIHPGDVATVTEAGHLIIDVALEQAGQMQ